MRQNTSIGTFVFYASLLVIGMTAFLGFKILLFIWRNANETAKEVNTKINKISWIFKVKLILLSFLAGAHWAYGMILRNWLLQVSSIVLSLAPWFALLLEKLNIIKELETVWTLILLDTMILLLIDYHYLHKEYDKRYLQLRCVATALLMLTIIVIILRHIAISKFT